jgi:hypothetical protein
MLTYLLDCCAMFDVTEQSLEGGDGYATCTVTKQARQETAQKICDGLTMTLLLHYLQAGSE